MSVHPIFQQVLVMFTTASQRHDADRQQRNFIDAEVRDSQRQIQLAVRDLVWACEKLHEAGGCRAYLEDTLTGLLDELSNLDDALNDKLDDVGLAEDVEFDVSGINELLARVQS